MTQPKQIKKWRVKLCDEDGNYVLDDGFLTKDEAETSAEAHAECYSEDDEVYVESYIAYSYGGGH